MTLSNKYSSKPRKKVKASQEEPEASLPQTALARLEDYSYSDSLAEGEADEVAPAPALEVEAEAAPSPHALTMPTDPAHLPTISPAQPYVPVFSPPEAAAYPTYPTAYPTAPEPPLYLRNPGPPPRLPRNTNVTNFGRSSFRLRNSGSARPNYVPHLVVCAIVGLVLLFVLIVIKPQNRSVDSNPAANRTSARATPNLTPVITAVPVAETFALVNVPEGLVLEEPRAGAGRVQILDQYTLLAFQRKSTAGWYQLKGGSGWINAQSVKTYPNEEAAWSAKREAEKNTPRP